MIRASHVVGHVAAASLLLLAGSATAQISSSSTESPASTSRPPMMGDSASNPSTYDQINRLKDGLDAQGRPRDKQPAAARSRPATAAEILVGSQVRDKRSKPVGTIEMVDKAGAIVTTAGGKVKVPLEAFGMDEKGLVIGITKTEFDRLVASANAAPAG